jgi:hypothetical protein
MSVVMKPEARFRALFESTYPTLRRYARIALEWTLPRTIDALEHLEAALANAGQILTRTGHHSYTLSPRPGLLHRREIARCLRHTRDPLDLPAAAVLHRALTSSREGRARDR